MNPVAGSGSNGKSRQQAGKLAIAQMMTMTIIVNLVHQKSRTVQCKSQTHSFTNFVKIGKAKKLKGWAKYVRFVLRDFFCLFPGD